MGGLKYQGKPGEIPALSRNGQSPSACLQRIAQFTLRVKGLSD